MMADTIDVPKVGKLRKSQVMAVVGVGGGILLYAWWRSRSSLVDDSAGAEPEAVPEDPYEGLTNSGGGAPINGYPSGGGGSDTGSTAPRTNAEWSQLAAEKLADSYEPGVINAALGRYLGRQPLTTLDQEVVRAAIARAGYPPEGSYTVIPGGDTGITVPPGDVKATATTNSAVISWSPVSGAASYYVYRSGQSAPIVANGTSVTLQGLTPKSSYTVQVAAVSAGGKTGPKSSSVTVKTSSVALKAPTGLKVTASDKSSVTVAWSPVAGAQYYRVYVNGTPRGASEPTTGYRIGSLRPNTSYKIQVAADTTNDAPGPKSAALTAKTKK